MIKVAQTSSGAPSRPAQTSPPVQSQPTQPPSQSQPIQTSSPPTEPKFLGMDRPTAITAIVVPFVLAILGAWFGVWLTKKWRDKLRVKVVCKLNDKKFGQFSALYCERVQHYERVPPNHFRAFLRRDHSATSINISDAEPDVPLIRCTSCSQQRLLAIFVDS